MSRIDEALRTLERPAATPPDSTSPETIARTSTRVSLEQYPGEPGAAVDAGIHADAPSRDDAASREDAGVRDRRSLATPWRARSSHKPGAAESRSRLIDRHAPAIQVEQYRRLAASLHDAQWQREVKTVMVTSAVPGEGKTLTAVNLALTLSESYNRSVLLIDADLRWPSVHDVLGLSNTVGLSEALRDEALEMPFVDVSSKFSVLLAGHPGLKPLAGLTSERMGSLLDEFETRFDWVLIDTPPVGFLPDARLLARLIRSVILVIGAGSTPAAVVERAVAEIGQDCILGTVLNRIEDSEIPDAGYYYGGTKPSARVS